MKVKEESAKVGLKLNIQKTKIKASSPVTSWQIDGETVADFILGGSKITADGDCSHEIKSCLLLGRKVMTNLDSMLKGRDITLPTKVHLVKAMVFPVVMYGCESWTIRKAEHRSYWCFWTVVLEKILESLLDCKEIQPVHPKGDQSWVFIGRTEAEAEAPILWPPDVKNWVIGKDSDAAKDWRQEEKGGWQRMRWLMTSLTQWTWVWKNCGSWWWTGRPGVLQSMGSQRVGHNWAIELNIWFVFKYLFNYLTVPGLSCGMWNLWLQHVGSGSLARDQTQALCIGSLES